MKKRKKIICGIAAAIIGCLVLLAVCFDFTNTYSLSGGMVNGTRELSKGDERKIKWIFNHDLLYSDCPSCGFGEDASISFNDGETVFYIAQDTCPIIYDKAADKYFRITELSKKWLYSILKDYGVTFPCI